MQNQPQFFESQTCFVHGDDPKGQPDFYKININSEIDHQKNMAKICSTISRGFSSKNYETTRSKLTEIKEVKENPKDFIAQREISCSKVTKKPGAHILQSKITEKIDVTPRLLVPNGDFNKRKTVFRNNFQIKKEPGAMEFLEVGGASASQPVDSQRSLHSSFVKNSNMISSQFTVGNPAEDFIQSNRVMNVIPNGLAHPRNRAISANNMLDLHLLPSLSPNSNFMMINQRRRKTNKIDLSEYESECYNIYGDNDDDFAEEIVPGIKRHNVNWQKLDPDPKVETMVTDNRVVESEICRRVYLGPKPTREKTCQNPHIKFLRNELRKDFEMEIAQTNKNHSEISQRNGKSLSVLQCSLEESIKSDIEKILGVRKSEMFKISLQSNEPKKDWKDPDLTWAKKVMGVDKYFGLSNWHMFHGRNLRPQNFQYSKIYPGMKQLMVNTTDNILGLRYDRAWKTINTLRLYQNNEPQQIEDFACNSVLRSQDRLTTLAIKHMNDNRICLFDCESQIFKQKIKIDASKSILNSNFTRKKSTFRAPFVNPQGQVWAAMEKKKRKTVLTNLFGKGQKNLAISETEAENSSGEREMYYMEHGVLISMVERSPSHDTPVTQHLEHHENLIFYVDNFFRFLIFDDRENKHVIMQQFRDSSKRIGRQSKARIVLRAHTG